MLEPAELRLTAPMSQIPGMAPVMVLRTLWNLGYLVWTPDGLPTWGSRTTMKGTLGPWKVPS